MCVAAGEDGSVVGVVVVGISLFGGGDEAMLCPWGGCDEALLCPW